MILAVPQVRRIVSLQLHQTLAVQARKQGHHRVHKLLQPHRIILAGQGPVIIVKRIPRIQRETHFEVERAVHMRFCPNEVGDAMRKNFMLISSRSIEIAMKYPLINFGLDPRNHKPSEDKAEVGMISYTSKKIQLSSTSAEYHSHHTIPQTHLCQECPQIWA